MKKNVIIIGAGGYAKSVIDSLDDKYIITGFIDEYKTAHQHLGYPILGKKLDDLEKIEEYSYFIAIGDNKDRKYWFDKLKEHNLNIITVIDKSAIVSKHAMIEEGCFIGKMAIVNSNAYVGCNSIINTRALVEHGCIVGQHVNVSTNTVLNGDVKVGPGCFIGSCSVVNGQLLIGEWAIIGSGAVVVRNIEGYTVNVGIPAKKIKG